VSGPTARLIDIDDPAWSETVASVPHDIYHLPAYAKVSADHERGQAHAVLVEDSGRSMLLPLVIRDLGGGATDATSPYGYPGPIGTGVRDVHFLTAAFAQASEALRGAGSVSLFVRFHPLLNGAPPPGSGTVVDHGETVEIDLGLTSQERWRQMRENHRRDIRRATKDGFDARLETSDEAFATFQDLYQGTMSRLGASPYYRFDRAHFQALRSALGTRLWLAMVRVHGEPAAAGLFFREAGVVQYHLSGSDARYLDHQPTKLMIDAVARWAKERGDRRFHLGGGVGAADDALLHFKAGFSPLRHRFVTLRRVLDDAEYRRRVRLSGANTQPEDGSGYFPAYRRR
jgi:hypothetical protein